MTLLPVSHLRNENVERFRVTKLVTVKLGFTLRVYSACVLFTNIPFSWVWGADVGFTYEPFADYPNPAFPSDRQCYSGTSLPVGGEDAVTHVTCSALIRVSNDYSLVSFPF